MPVTVACCNCGGGIVDEPPLNCPASYIAYSDYAFCGALKESVEGTVFEVRCNEGFTAEGDTSVVCGAEGSWTPLVCLPSPCNPTEVANSDYSSTGSITGVTGASVNVTCNTRYSGGGLITCGSDNVFTSVTCNLDETEAPATDVPTEASATDAPTEAHETEVEDSNSSFSSANNETEAEDSDSSLSSANTLLTSDLEFVFSKGEKVMSNNFVLLCLFTIAAYRS